MHFQAFITHPQSQFQAHLAFYRRLTIVVTSARLRAMHMRGQWTHPPCEHHQDLRIFLFWQRTPAPPSPLGIVNVNRTCVPSPGCHFQYRSCFLYALAFSCWLVTLPCKCASQSAGVSREKLCARPCGTCGGLPYRIVSELMGRWSRDWTGRTEFPPY